MKKKLSPVNEIVENAKNIESLIDLRKYLETKNIQFNIRCSTRSFDEFVTGLPQSLLRYDESASPLIQIILSKEALEYKDPVECYVNFSECYRCCGKLYLYNFEYYPNIHDLSDDKQTLIDSLLLIAAELIAQEAGYTYIGFVHRKDCYIVDTSKHLGFKTLIEFKNKRSNNTLEEMCKILK